MRLRCFFSSFYVVTFATVAIFAANGGAAKAQISLTSLSAQYTQDFNSLAVDDQTKQPYTDNSTIFGFYALYGAGALGTGGTSPSEYKINDGILTDPVGGLTSFGTQNGSDRAFGAIVNNTNTATDNGFIAYGFRFVNNDALNSITQFQIEYTGEQWRRQNTISNQTVAFSYAVFDSGTDAIGRIGASVGYASDSNLDFTALGGTSSQGGLISAATKTKSDTIIATVRPGQELWVRWVDINDPGQADHYAGIDDFSINATFTPFDPTPAPPGFVSALIGSVVGAAHFGRIRWRNRRRLRKQ